MANAAETPRLIIHDVAVIDTRTGELLRDRDVVITGDRIVSVEPAKTTLDEGSTVIDGRGKFLLPGLWDMEVHLSWTTASALPLLIANGVTDVRDMGSNLEEIETWRSRISTGLMVGPHILRVGPMLNGKSFNQYQMVVGPPEQAKGVVRTLKFIGMDGLSLERRVPRDSYFAIMSEAKDDRIPVGGHIPIGVTPDEASDAGSIGKSKSRVRQNSRKTESFETPCPGYGACFLAKPTHRQPRRIARTFSTKNSFC